MKNQSLDAILIDDDPLVHAMWEFSAQKYNKKIRTFFSADEFFIISDDLLRNIPIYIDSNLGESVKGEIIAKKIYDLGFKNIILATGENAFYFRNFDWLKDVTNKMPPWE